MGHKQIFYLENNVTHLGLKYTFRETFVKYTPKGILLYRPLSYIYKYFNC